MSGSSTVRRSRKPRVADREPSDSVREFIVALQDVAASENILFGMVRPAETTDGLLFAHAGDCGRWVYIPATAIHHVRPSGRVGCGVHSHAAAEIVLKEPQSDLEKTFASIGGLHRARLEAVLAGGQPGSESSHKCDPGFKWQLTDRGWACAPYP